MLAVPHVLRLLFSMVILVVEFQWYISEASNHQADVVLHKWQSEHQTCNRQLQ